MRTPFRMLAPALLALAFVATAGPPRPASGAPPTIGVRGHWVVEVHDPDGTPVTRTEFHNALADVAKIPKLLDGELTPGPLAIAVDCAEAGCVPPCPSTCLIVEPRSNSSDPSPSIFKNLTVTVVPGGLQLRGSATSTTNATVSRFSTHIYTCGKGATPMNCGVIAPLSTVDQPLTTATQAPGIAVVTGQAVQVTVTLTFVTAPAPATPSTAGAPR